MTPEYFFRRHDKQFFSDHAWGGAVHYGFDYFSAPNHGRAVVEEIPKEGESGQQKINMYTRLATVPLALLQAFGFIKLLHQSQAGIFGNLTTVRLISIMLIVTAGTVFLMWFGRTHNRAKSG